MLSNETKKMINSDLQKEVDRQINDYPIRIKIDGVSVDPENIIIAGGEIRIDLNSETLKNILKRKS